MVNFLMGKASGRKFRLFACACCRRQWHLTNDPDGWKAIEVAEEFADGLATRNELRQAEREAGNAGQRLYSEYLRHRDEWPLYVAHAATIAFSWAASLVDDPAGCGSSTSNRVAQVYATHAQRNDEQTDVWRGYKWEEYASQALLLRDIIGNPFRPPPPLAPSLLTLNGGLLVKLAEAVYGNRVMPAGTLDSDRLAVLADALEEAGVSGEMISHLRGAGQHWRGCWVLDALLGKE
jgi:hypothetical protein